MSGMLERINKLDLYVDTANDDVELENVLLTNQRFF